MKKVNKTGYKLNGEKVEVKYETEDGYFVNVYYSYDDLYNDGHGDYLDEDTLIKLPKSAVTFQEPRVILAEKVAEIIAEKDRLNAEIRELQNERRRQTEGLKADIKKVLDYEAMTIDIGRLRSAKKTIAYFTKHSLKPFILNVKKERIRFMVEGFIGNQPKEHRNFIGKLYSDGQYTSKYIDGKVYIDPTPEELKEAMKARVEAAGGVLELVRPFSTAGVETYKELLKYALPKEVKTIEDKITEIRAKELAEAEKMKNRYEQKRLKDYWVETRIAREMLAVALVTALFFALIIWAVYSAEICIKDLDRKDRHLQEQINQLKNDLELCKTQSK
jgi:hypothetical protein